MHRRSASSRTEPSPSRPDGPKRPLRDTTAHAAKRPKLDTPLSLEAVVARSSDTAEDDDEDWVLQPARRRRSQSARTRVQRPGSSAQVQRALQDPRKFADIAAKTVWGDELAVKARGEPPLQAFALAAEDIPARARRAMLVIWRPHRADLASDHPDDHLDPPPDDEQARAMFPPGAAALCIAPRDDSDAVRAFCILEPETEQLGRGRTEDVVWLLHMHAHPAAEKHDFQAQLMQAAAAYCRAVGIRKNVATAATPTGTGRGKSCSNEWIRTLQTNGWKYSKDSVNEGALRRWQRTIRV